ncbi:MAG: hypothetical protein HY561_03425 [Gemmatimonadetes bacterium]|nr:hypothetical protein [Gemmatimonadota bacterium]
MMRPGPRRSAWRSFTGRQRRAIQAQLAQRTDARCPCCGELLEARPNTRLRAVLPSGCGGFDLDCRPCRRFHPLILHTPRSLYLARLQRLASAVLRA